MLLPPRIGSYCRQSHIRRQQFDKDSIIVRWNLSAQLIGGRNCQRQLSNPNIQHIKLQKLFCQTSGNAGSYMQVFTVLKILPTVAATSSKPLLGETEK